MLICKSASTRVVKTVIKMKNLTPFLNKTTDLERPIMLLWFAERSLVEVNAFNCSSEKKMHNFTLFWTTAAGQNGDFQTFLDFEETKARWDILIVFSKITH